MPSRILHDILGHILEHGDVHHVEAPEPTVMSVRDNFYNQYMQRPHELLTLRATVSEHDLENLPPEVYHEFLELINSWVASGEPINVNRRFRRVYLSRVDRVPSPESFRNVFRLEFKIGDFDAEQYTRETWGMGTRRSAIINPMINPITIPDGVEVFGQKPVMEKVEEHFEDDLFKL